MLNIIKSGFFSGVEERMIDRIRALTEGGKRAYLIVPEQQTVTAEGQMAERLPSYAPLTFEVTNFTRFANSTFRALGGIAGEYCDSGKQALIMWRTLTELSPVLTMTQGRREIGAGLVERALRAVKEMQSLAITPEMLATISDTAEVREDKRLHGKLSDLSEIYALYKRLLSEKFSDTLDDATMMLERLKDNPDFLRDTEIFITGFTSFTEPQYALIGAIAARTELTLYLTVPKARGDAFEYGEIRQTEKRLKGSARLAGAEIRLKVEDDLKTVTPDELTSICNILWAKYSHIDNIYLQNEDTLRIFEALTPYEECDFIANDILKRVMSGARFSDFAVVARSIDKYRGILDTAFEKAGVPLFSGFRQDISSFEVIKLIYTAYAVIGGGFRREDVITYAKCGLSSVSREMCDEFEVYVNKWGINGSRFTDGDAWNMNPAGYDTKRPRGADAMLKRIDETRRALITPLLLFKNATDKATTVTEQAEALFTLLTSLRVEDNLEKRAAALGALGERRFAEENLRLFGIICDALDAMVEVSGSCPADAEAFLGQLKILFSSATIAHIPPSRDSVTAGSADMLRLRGKKHIYLIGVNAGEFPAHSQDDSYFSERDKLTLCRLGLSISPELEIKNARELYIFSRAFSYAEESVTLLYTKCDTRMKEIQPAEVIATVERITGGSVKPRGISGIEVSERLYAPESALEDSSVLSSKRLPEVKAALMLSGYGGAVKMSEAEVGNTSERLSSDICERVFGKPLELSQSRIDAFVNCPLAHFCRYTVRLDREKKAEFDAMGIGSFIHAILENFFTEAVKEGRTVSELSRTERAEMTRAAAKKYIDLLGESVGEDALQTEIKLGRLCRAAGPVVEGLCEEFSQSKFTPRFFELRITDENDGNPDPLIIKTEGEDVIIKGIIDRVDTYKGKDGTYIRVIDYKTGKKVFSPEDLEKGNNLQMFLYLKALLDTEREEYRKRIGLEGEEKLLPAGVIYVKTSVKDTQVTAPDDALASDEVKRAQKREGMANRSEEIIEAMGGRYVPGYSARGKGGAPKYKEDLLFDEKRFEALMETVEGSVKRVAEGIRSGDASALPKTDSKGNTHCETCEFKPFCRTVKINN